MASDAIYPDSATRNTERIVTLRALTSVDYQTLAFFATVAVIISLAITVRIVFGAHIREDAYITLRYAQHIAAGKGFVFNEGERVLGTTTPLFALLLAALARLGIEPTASSVALGIICDAAAMAVLGLIAARFVRPLAVLFTLLTYALLSPIVSYAVSGMETSFYMLLILLSLLAYGEGRVRLTGLSCALVVLTRPDGAILALVLGLHMFIYRRRDLLQAGIVFVGVLAPWIVFATAYFGSPIPQSIVAKMVSEDVSDRWVSLRNFVWYFSDLENRWFLPLTPVFILGILRSKWDKALVVLTGWAIAYSTAFIVFNKFLFPNLPFEWYFVPLLMLFALGIGVGLEGIVSYSARFLNRDGGWARNVMAVLAAAVFLAGYVSVLRYQHSELGRVVGGREESYKKLAERMAEMGVKDEVVAAYEIGTFSYYYPGPVLDLYGLVTPQVVGANRRDVLFAARPQWVMGYLDLLPTDITGAPWFRREYKRVYALGTWEGRVAALFRRYPPTDEAAQTGQAVRLGNSMQLLGVDVQATPLGPQKMALHVTLSWKALSKMDRHYTVFVHLRDASEKMIAQHDSEPQANQYPTNLWQVGETVADIHDLVIPQDRIDGDSTLVIGAYETNNVKHLLRWSSPTVAQWPHELRIPVKSLGIESSQ